MQVREATAEDAEGIRSVARASLSASYGAVLTEDVIEAAVQEWYAEDFDQDLADERSVYLVADDEDDGVVGFSQSYLVGEDAEIGEIAWLHVAPEARGEGVGSQLFTETERALHEAGATTLVGRVLAANKAGVEFYDSSGYEPGDDREVRVGDETFVERTFLKLSDAEGEDVTEIGLDRRQLPDGRAVYVAYDEADRASRGPLYAVYLDDERDRRYGWYCSACGSFDVAMDSMGRAQCAECGNERKPTRWDASYL